MKLIRTLVMAARIIEKSNGNKKEKSIDGAEVQ
jgi:hypothetical protein